MEVSAFRWMAGWGAHRGSKDAFSMRKFVVELASETKSVRIHRNEFGVVGVRLARKPIVIHCWRYIYDWRWGEGFRHYEAEC